MLWEFNLGTRGNLALYDEMGAWPIMVDEFMEWMNENK